MSPQDPETPPPLPLTAEPKRGLPKFAVIGLMTMLLGLLLALEFASARERRALGFKAPSTSSLHLFEREIELEDALAGLSGIEARMLSPLVGTARSARNDAIEAWAEVEQTVARLAELAPSESVEARARLTAARSVLLGEVGRLNEARARLDELRTGGHASLVDAIARAYSGLPATTGGHVTDYQLELLGDGYVRESLELQLAEAVGDEARARTLADERAARADRWRSSCVRLFGTYLAVLLSGLVVLLTWVARNRPTLPQATAASPPPWSLDDGFRAGLLSAFLGAFLLILMNWLDQWPALGFLTAFTTLIASVPMLVLVQRKLLAPHGLTFRRAFGLESLGGPLKLVLIVLALLAVDELGSRAISTAFSSLGLQSHWTETAIESFLSPDRWRTYGLSFDAIAWAPALEEIGCRGLLFLTLRRSYGPTRAAILSAMLFASMHVVSIPSFATAIWSGVVWAIAFERTKSLLPAMICHTLGNAYAVVTMFVLYRP